MVCNNRVTWTATALLLVSSAWLTPSPASADPHRPVGHEPGGVDSEHMFGFVTGTDMGGAGEIEVEAEQDSGFSKRGGRYYAASNALQLKYTVIDNFRIAPHLEFGHQHIAGVAGIDDMRQFGLAAGGVEFKYRALNRGHAPFGLTFAVDTSVGRIDLGTGQRVRDYALDFSAAVDRELINDRLYGAINFNYTPAWTRDILGGWARSGAIGIGGAMVSRIGDGVYAGGEVRYIRAYDSAGLSAFCGDAVFAGPTLYVMLSQRANMTFAWNLQVHGHALGQTAGLDLTNFERHQVRVRLGIGF
jgi:hypothetical protein